METTFPLLAELLESIQQLAPEVWDVYMYQMQINAYTASAASIALLIAAIVCLYAGYTEDGAFYIFATFFAMFFALAFHAAVGFSLNPEYYAIKEILSNLQ